jgi:hypothetical protein
VAYTPYFLSVNGLNVPATMAGRRRSDLDKWGRGNGTVLTGTTFAPKSQIAFETPPMTAVAAHGLSGWVRGLGHHFTFEWYDEHRATTQFTLYSSDGGARFTEGAAGTAKWGSYGLSIPSGAGYTVTVNFGNEAPFSFSVWRNQLSANTWELCSMSYDGATARYFAGPGGTGVTGEFGWSILNYDTGVGRVTLQGRDGDGTSTAVDYDGVMILPYSLSTAQLAARHDRLNSEPAFPLVAVGGHITRSLPEIACKGMVQSYPVHRVVLDGAWRDNARRVVGTLLESHELTDETAYPEPAGPPLELPAQPAHYYPLATEEERVYDGIDVPYGDRTITNYWGTEGLYHYITNPTGGTLMRATNTGLDGWWPEWSADPAFDGYHEVEGLGTYNGTTIAYAPTANDDHNSKMWQPRTGDFSMFCHFRIRAGTRDSFQNAFLLFSNWNLGAEPNYSGWRVYVSTSGIVLQYGRIDESPPAGNFASAAATATIVDETWYSCGVVFDRTAGYARLYLDGVEVASVALASSTDIGLNCDSYGKAIFGGWNAYTSAYGPVHIITAGDFREIMFWPGTAITGANMGALHSLFESGTPLRTELGLT